MKGNNDKCHVMLSSQDRLHVNIGTKIENSKCEKLLVLILIQNEGHINQIRKKASPKLNAFSRISYYTDPL